MPVFIKREQPHLGTRCSSKLKRSHIKTSKEYLLYDLLAYRVYEEQSNGIIVIYKLQAKIVIAYGYAGEGKFCNIVENSCLVNCSE